MNLFDLFAKISLDTTEYEKSIISAKSSIDGLGHEISTELAQIEGATTETGESAQASMPKVSSFGDELMSLTKATAVVTVLKQVADAMIDLAKAGISYNMEIETYTANLGVLLGSEEAATKKIEELRAMDATSPFDLSSLLDATQQLLAYGIAAEDTGRVLQELGDISLGNTEKFNGLAYAYAQMNAAGKANMQDIRQMINAGFNPLNAIAELTGESMTELQERVSAGKVAFSEIQTAIRYATSAVGTFTEEDRKAAAEFAKNQLTVSDATQERLDAQESAYEKEIEDLEAQYTAQQKVYKKQEKALKDSINERIKALQKAHDEELDAVDELYEAQLKELEKSQEEQLEALEKSQEAEIAEFQKATDAKIALIDRQYTESLKLIDEEKYRQIKAIEEQIAALEGRTEAEEKTLRDRERAEKKAQLERQVETASSVRFRKAAEKELADYLEEIRMEDLEEERKAKIEALEVQKESVEEQATAKKDSLEEEYDAQVKAVNAEAEERLKKVKEEQEAETDLLKEQQEAQTELIKEEQEKQTELIKEQQEEQLDSYRNTLNAELEALQEKNSAALASYKKDIEEQKAYVTQMHEIALASIESEQSAVTESIESVEGRFYEGMSKQSDTLAGKLSALEAKWNAFLGERTEGLTDWIENTAVPFLEKMIEAADKFLTIIENLPLFNLSTIDATSYNPYNVQRIDVTTPTDGFDPSTYTPPVTSQYFKPVPLGPTTDARIQSINILYANPNISADEIGKAVQEGLDEWEAAND